MINQTANNTLKTGDLFIVQITVVVDPDASGTSGPLNNQATTGGNAVDDMGNPITDSTGAPITTTDDSDNGTDPNSDNGSGTSDDPTPLAIPDLSTAKSVLGSPVANGDNWDVTFEVVLENTGTVDLNGIDLFDDLAMQFGPAFVSVDQTSLALDTTGVASGSLPTLNTTFDGSTDTNLLNNDGVLATGDFLTVTFTVTVDPDASGASGPLLNQATGAGDDPSGMETTDVSDNGTDPNGENGEDNGDGTFGNDPTPIEIADIATTKAVVGSTPNGENFDVTFELILENTGTVDLTGVDLFDDLATQLGAAFVGVSGTPTLDATGVVAGTAPTLNTNYDGSTDVNLLNTDGCLLYTSPSPRDRTRSRMPSSA